MKILCEESVRRSIKRSTSIVPKRSRVELWRKSAASLSTSQRRRNWKPSSATKSRGKKQSVQFVLTFSRHHGPREQKHSCLFASISQTAKGNSLTSQINR